MNLRRSLKAGYTSKIDEITKIENKYGSIKIKIFKMCDSLCIQNITDVVSNYVSDICPINEFINSNPTILIEDFQTEFTLDKYDVNYTQYINIVLIYRELIV